MSYPKTEGHEESPFAQTDPEPEPSCQQGPVSSPLLPSVMLNVLFVYVVLAVYLVRPHVFYSSLALHEGKLPAKLRFVICHHQSSVCVVGAMDSILSIKR